MRFEIGNIIYTVNGVPYTNDVAPFIDPIYDRTMIPLRAVSEALGAEVIWLNETRTVVIITSARTHSIEIGVPLVGGMGTPVIRDNRTFVPLRYVAELLGAQTHWDSSVLAAYVFIE